MQLTIKPTPYPPSHLSLYYVSGVTGDNFVGCVVAGSKLRDALKDFLRGKGYRTVRHEDPGGHPERDLQAIDQNGNVVIYFDVEDADLIREFIQAC